MNTHISSEELNKEDDLQFADQRRMLPREQRLDAQQMFRSVAFHGIQSIEAICHVA